MSTLNCAPRSSGKAEDRQPVPPRRRAEKTPREIEMMFRFVTGYMTKSSRSAHARNRHGAGKGPKTLELTRSGYTGSLQLQTARTMPLPAVQEKAREHAAGGVGVFGRQTSRGWVVCGRPSQAGKSIRLGGLRGSR